MRYYNIHRLELRLLHFRQIIGWSLTVFYLEAINVLNINSLFGYTYSRDYSVREKIQNNFGRRTVTMGGINL